MASRLSYPHQQSQHASDWHIISIMHAIRTNATSLRRSHSGTKQVSEKAQLNLLLQPSLKICHSRLQGERSFNVSIPFHSAMKHNGRKPTRRVTYRANNKFRLCSNGSSQRSTRLQEIGSYYIDYTRDNKASRKATPEARLGMKNRLE